MKVGSQADVFGELIVTQMRDPAIAYFDGLASGRWKAPALVPLEKRLAALDAETLKLVRACVVRAVDAGLGQFLFQLQEANEHGRKITVTIDGQNIADQSDGLHGELWSDVGWLARFSKYGESGDPPE